MRPIFYGVRLSGKRQSVRRGKSYLNVWREEENHESWCKEGLLDLQTLS